MTNAEILSVALRQSALEFGCEAKDFLSPEPKVVLSRAVEGARAGLPLPLKCDIVSYGSNLIAMAGADTRDTVLEYITRTDVPHAFETPNIRLLDKLLEPYDLQVCFMAEYFLPDAEALRPLPCRYELRLLGPADFKSLYIPAWSNALCARRPHLDVLGVGAYDGNRLIGLAGCSADCETMWQIGVDVLPEYRRQGIAAALTSRLALEILARGRVPFYCAAWCNLPSVRNAIRAGFRPAWAELTARDKAFVERMLPD